MNDRLTGKATLVLGGGSGIGAETARRLAAESAKVCVADINLESAERIAHEIAEMGGESFALGVDIADEASVNATVAAAAERLGGRLDGAHVNAADLRVIRQDSDALAVDLSVFDRTMAVNLRGHLLCTRAILPYFLKQKAGSIVYTSSGASATGDPERPAYACSKAGLEALMRHVASRWGRDGITSNCVAPGVVITPEVEASRSAPQEFIDTYLARTPAPRLGRVQDIAAVVAMLLSEDGRWINGQVFHVNGGAHKP